jgi:uncharacterized membrane protein YtjA (UPF0391 family)
MGPDVSFVDALPTSCNSELEFIVGNLLYWAVVLIVVAIFAAFLGFGGTAGVAAGGAQMLIYAAIAIVVVGAVVALVRRA